MFKRTHDTSDAVEMTHADTTPLMPNSPGNSTAAEQQLHDVMIYRITKKIKAYEKLHSRFIEMQLQCKAARQQLEIDYPQLSKQGLAVISNAYRSRYLENHVYFLSLTDVLSRNCETLKEQCATLRKEIYHQMVLLASRFCSDAIDLYQIHYNASQGIQDEPQLPDREQLRKLHFETFSNIISMAKEYFLFYEAYLTCLSSPMLSKNKEEVKSHLASLKTRIDNEAKQLNSIIAAIVHCGHGNKSLHEVVAFISKYFYKHIEAIRKNYITRNEELISTAESRPLEEPLPFVMHQRVDIITSDAAWRKYIQSANTKAQKSIRLLSTLTDARERRNLLQIINDQFKYIASWDLFTALKLVTRKTELSPTTDNKNSVTILEKLEKIDRSLKMLDRKYVILFESFIICKINILATPNVTQEHQDYVANHQRLITYFVKLGRAYQDLLNEWDELLGLLSRKASENTFSEVCARTANRHLQRYETLQLQCNRIGEKYFTQTQPRLFTMWTKEAGYFPLRTPRDEIKIIPERDASELIKSLISSQFV